MIFHQLSLDTAIESKAPVQIPLTQGKFALIDAEDFERVNQWKWQADCRNKRWVARRIAQNEGSPKVRTMHRFILNAPPGLSVDHKNGDALDNRKENLRLCTLSQNQANKRKYKGKSKYKGVRYRQGLTKPWRAAIKQHRKEINLGYFLTEREAGEAYNEAAKRLFGEFALLNGIEDGKAVLAA